MRSSKAIGAVSFISLVVLAACSGLGPSSSTPHDVPSLGDLPAVRRAVRLAPAPPIPGAVKGGTLRVLSDYGLATLDPSEAYYTNTVSLDSGLLIRSLTQYVYDPKLETMVLVPDLATDLGRPSDDFMTWKFTLRKGVRFENGKPVTPYDMKFGIERSFDRDNFPSGATYSNQYFLDGSTYSGPYQSDTDYRGVSIDGRTLTIRMSKPFPDMPYWAAFPAMSPIPPGRVSSPQTYKLHPLSTGPYMIRRYNPDSSLVLVKNPYWDPATDPGRHQYVDRIEMSFSVASARIASTILSDEGTAKDTVSADSISLGDYARFEAAASDRLIRGGFTCTYMWVPDNRKITDIRVRRALAWAFPYQAVWRATGAIPGVTRIPATNIEPPGTPGRVPYNPVPGHSPGTTDAAKARAILQAVGETGYPISFAYMKDVPEDVRVKNVIVRALRAAGFHPHPRAVLAKDYVEDYRQNPSAPANVRSVGWCSDWPTGMSWFPDLFASRSRPLDGAGFNLSFFSQPPLDRRISAISRLPLSQQPAAWNSLDRLIQTRYFPVVVTGYAAVAMPRGSDVAGARVDAVLGQPTWKDIWLRR